MQLNRGLTIDTDKFNLMTAEDATDLAAQEVIERKKDQDEGSEKS